MPSRTPMEIVGFIIFFALVFFVTSIIIENNLSPLWGIIIVIVIFAPLAFLINKIVKPYKRADSADTIPSDDSRYISTEVKNAVWQRDHGRCVICGSNRHLHWDHDIPFSKGGSNTVDNIRILCQKCNLRKSDKIE